MKVRCREGSCQNDRLPLQASPGVSEKGREACGRATQCAGEKRGTMSMPM